MRIVLASKELNEEEELEAMFLIQDDSIVRAALHEESLNTKFHSCYSLTTLEPSGPDSVSGDEMFESILDDLEGFVEVHPSNIDTVGIVFSD